MDQMDGFLRVLLGTLSSSPELTAWLATDGLLQQLVVGIDRVAQGGTPAPDLKVLAPKEPLTTAGRGRTRTIDPASYRRYDGIAEAVASVDPAAVAATHGRSNGAEVGHVYRHALQGFSARLTPAALKALSNDPRIAAVVPDRQVHITAQTTPWGVSRVQAPEAWAIAGTGTGIKVGIIDSGGDVDHPDLNWAGGYNAMTGSTACPLIVRGT